MQASDGRFAAGDGDLERGAGVRRGAGGVMRGRNGGAAKGEEALEMKLRRR